MSWSQRLKDWWNTTKYDEAVDRYPEITEKILFFINQNYIHGNKLPDGTQLDFCIYSGTTFNDLHFDSLDIIELIMDIEDEYDIVITDEVLVDNWPLQKILELSNYIGDLIAKNSSK